MKTTRISLLFYNSILIFTLVTVGFATSSYQDLTPTILLIPVGMYFALSLANQFTKVARFVTHQSAHNFKKILRLYSLMVVLLLTLSTLASSSNFIQATLTVLLLPLIISFLLDISNKKTVGQFRLKKIITLAKVFESTDKLSQSFKKLSAKPKATTKTNKKEVTKATAKELVTAEETTAGELVTEEFEEMMDIKDAKRRQFLKIIGGSGVSMLLMLFVFPQKASASFFGSAPGPGVVGIKDSDGNKIDPAEKQPTDGYNISELDDDSSPSYYGFIHKNGSWYIAKEDSAGAYRYTSGTTGFSTNWTNRASLTYDYFDTIF